MIGPLTRITSVPLNCNASEQGKKTLHETRFATTAVLVEFQAVHRRLG
jgi:hypothetical protein